MRVLVDTSIWINHFRRSQAELQARLIAGQVWTHTVVIGELAAGQLQRRADVLRHLQKLPRADAIDLEEGLRLIDQYALTGRGLSWNDVQLLAAARIDGAAIWTWDKALAHASEELGVNYTG